jgi:fatty acid/phospholipid biosynthesis enzyme
MLNYRGFAEPTDTEKLDVLVTDGLTGNIGLKFIEATIQFYKSRLGVFRNLMHFFRVGAETSRHTGAFVLGLGNNSVIVKVHGAAKAKDFATAYKKAADFSKPIAVKAYVYPGLSAAIEAEFYKRFAEQQKPFKHLNEA